MMKYLIFGSILIIHTVIGQDYSKKNGTISIPCSVPEDCKSMFPHKANTSCIEYECYCSSTEEEPLLLCERSDIVVTISNDPSSLVGRRCKHEKDCNLEYGFCNNSRSQCECQKGYVPSSNNQRCLLIATTIGSTCEDDKQCLAFSANTTCFNATCKCVSGYHHTNSKCYKTVAFGEPCNFKEECKNVLGAECSAGLCTCSKDTVISPKNNECLLLAQKILDSCSESIQCSKKFGDKSECIEAKCVCQEGHHFDNEVHRCVRSKGLGDICEGNHECYQDETEYEQRAMQCIADQCQCSTGFEKKDNICVSVSGAATLTLSMTLILSALFYMSL